MPPRDVSGGCTDSVGDGREGGPTIFAEVKNGKGVSLIVDLVLSAWRACGASHGVGAKPGPSS